MTTRRIIPYHKLKKSGRKVNVKWRGLTWKVGRLQRSVHMGLVGKKKPSGVCFSYLSDQKDGTTSKLEFSMSLQALAATLQLVAEHGMLSYDDWLLIRKRAMENLMAENMRKEGKG